MIEHLTDLAVLAASDMTFKERVFSFSPDTTIYFFMGSIGSLLFGIRLVMMFIGGDVHTGDFDVDADADIGGIEVHDVGFSIISLLSILSFMMSAGWMGYLCRTEWEFNGFLSAAVASAFGFSMMMLASGGMYSLKRLQQSGHYDVHSCVGATGRVYLKIPEKGSGAGQVEVTIGGRKSVMSAVSSADSIDSFTTVKVIEVRDDGVLVVEPL
ncbi:MAG: hypothetical protein GC159_00655 [Phycisphaera sp.]|nr:hypothetical protein [Phycisphaera sp.]